MKTLTLKITLKTHICSRISVKISSPGSDPGRARRLHIQGLNGTRQAHIAGALGEPHFTKNRSSNCLSPIPYGRDLLSASFEERFCSGEIR